MLYGGIHYSVFPKKRAVHLNATWLMPKGAKRSNALHYLGSRNLLSLQQIGWYLWDYAHRPE